MNNFRDVSVYKFNSNMFFSSDNDLKRPLATVVLCTYTHTERFKFLVYISLRKQVEPSTIFYNILQISGGKVTWRTMVASKINVTDRPKNRRRRRPPSVS